jgi:hypothetical protein
MIAFTETYSRSSGTGGLQALRKATEAAALQGWRVVAIPSEFGEDVSAADALDALPYFPEIQPAIWIGYIPTPDRYLALQNAALAKNIHLLNDLDAHLLAQEFDRYFPFLEGLTPKSVILRSAEEAAAAAEWLGFPIFVRGTVQSRKYKGLAACLAQNLSEFHILIAKLLETEDRSRGRVIARQFVPLRHVQEFQGFPQGREYRVFLLDRQVISLGYYWENQDPLSRFSPAEEAVVRNLAMQSAERITSRWVAIDIGQAETGDWWVIEMGDAQFSGFGQISALQLLGELGRRLKG